MTPSFSESATPSRLSAVPEDSTADGNDKKTKKRKSWGQVLPEPKTNLPPRKRAKTDDEKEQRRVERVLRNRRAAQSSRERKRQEVEALEKRNRELEDLLASVQETNLALVQELSKHRDGAVLPPSGPSPLKHTLSSQLFQNGAQREASTVNPASLSPPATDAAEEPVNETAGEASTQPTTQQPAAAAASDLTQRPAEMLCDLQCQMSEMAPATALSQRLAWMSLLASLISTSVFSACQRPLLQIAISLKAGFSLLPSPALLTTIIWLVTHRNTSRTQTSTSTSGSARNRTTTLATSPQPTTRLAISSASSWKPSTLRVKTLRKILSSSPSLARPLSDATFVALRLVTEGHDSQVEAQFRSVESPHVDELTERLKCTDLPSRETLLALLWTIRVEQQRLGNGGSIPGPDLMSYGEPQISTRETNLASEGSKRTMEASS